MPAEIDAKTEAGTETAHLQGESLEEMKKSGQHDVTASSLTIGVIGVIGAIGVEGEGESVMVLGRERGRRAQALRQRKESRHQI